VRRATLADSEGIKAVCDKCGMPADLEKWLADPRNIALIEGENVALFSWRWIGIYEAHVLFTARGTDALAIGREWLSAMFDAGAQMILAVVPEERKQAAWFARRLGFGFRGRIETIEGLSEMYQLESAR
jgi:hypothetical protein